MDNAIDISTFELIYIIVNSGMGSKVLRATKEYGIGGGTVLLGKGTVNNAILNFLALYEERKEIVLLGANKKDADYAIDMLNEKFKFEKPNRGIIFTTSLSDVIGSKFDRCEENVKKRGVNNSMYQFIITIVNKGKAEEVIDAATKAGSKGGTIVNARGSGIHETSKLFNMEIEPEKEVVMILSKEESTKNIVASIRENLELDKPGNGIILVQDVNRAYGIHE